MRPVRALVLALVTLTPACVSSGRYEAALAAQQNAEREAAALRPRIDGERARVKDLEVTASSLQRQLDDETAIDAQLRRELEKLGKDVDGLLSESSASSIAEARERLKELRRAQAAAEGRARLYADLLLRFKEMVDSGDLTVVVRDGRMVLRLSSDVLFDSGRKEIKPAGKKALAEIAKVLSAMGDRHFQVAGHTDDQPITLSPFSSNWELSTARALEVVRFLVERGMKSEMLSAAGYGEFDPVASNKSADGRAKNRRVEIVLQPKLEEFVVPATKM